MVANWAVDGLPIDLKISPDETFAVVRTASVGTAVTGYTYLLDLTLPGAPIQLVAAHPAGWNSSDFVEILDDYAVTSTWIGTGSTSRDLMIVPKTATSLAQVTIDNTLGNTPDVAVAYHATQLTSFAAVRGDGNVSLWDLATGTRTQTDYFAVLPCGGGGSGGVAIGCSDSIVMSGSRYATITNYQYPLSQFGIEKSSAIVIGAVAGSGANFPRTHQLTGSPNTNPPCTAQPYLLHDLVMTPDGRFTAVGGSRVLAVLRNRDGTLSDLQANPDLPTPRFVVSPTEWQTTDSIEATNRRIVFIGNEAPFSESPVPSATVDMDTFRVTIGDVDQPTPSYWHYRPADVGLSANTPSRVHDLAISPNGSRAAVTTRAGLLVFDLTAPIGTSHAPPAPPLFFPNAPDPLRFGMNIPPASNFESTSNAVFCSDSAACTDGAAVAIGRNRSTPPSGEVFVLDLTSGSMITFGLGADHIPTDLSITADGTMVAVRSIHRLGNVAANASRITVLSLPSGALLANFSSAAPLPSTDIGHALGRDQIECSNYFALSAGENLPVTWTAPTASGYTGWVQVVRLR
jgi:WD40 repeat protein